MDSNQVAKPKKSVSSIVINVVAIVLCVIFGIMLILNLTIIIQGIVNPDRPPAVFGTTPLVVLSGSMSGDAKDHIEVGDLVFIGKVDVEDLQVNDVITFKQGKSYVTHRIIREGVDEKTGERIFYTKGDANNAEDTYPVYKDEIIGIYEGKRIGKIGDFVLFMQSMPGMLIFIGIPVVLFLVVDFLFRRKQKAKTEKSTADLMAELEMLRAAQAAQAAAPTEAPKAEEAPAAQEAPAEETPAEEPKSDETVE